MNIADMTLQINPKILGIGHILAGEELNIGKGGVYTNTYTAPWYNGRERGLVFTLQVHFKCLHIAIFEHRNSDAICSLMWENDGYMNPPTMQSDGKLAYEQDTAWPENMKTVRFDEAGKMAAWVRETMQVWYDAKVCEENKKKGMKVT